MQASESSLATVLTHVFMPPSLPTSWSEADQRAESSNAFFSHFREFLLELPSNKGDFFGNLPDLLLPGLDSVLQPPSEAEILHRLEGLQDQDFWFYLGLHTCLLQFRSIDGRLSISGFDLHPSQKGCAGDLQSPLSFSDDPIPLTAQVLMPRVTIWACAEQVKQRAFACQLADLKVLPDLPGTAPKVQKAKQKVQESRQLAMPVYLFEWLLPFVALEERMEPVPFFKKMRTETIFSSGQPWVRSIQWNATRVLVHAALRQIYGDDPNKAELQYKLLLLHFLTWLLDRARKTSPKLIVLQMIQKLALRGQKLRSRWPEEVPATHPTIAYSMEVCKSVRDHLDFLWKETQERHAKAVAIAPFNKMLEGSFVQDARHSFDEGLSSFLLQLTRADTRSLVEEVYPPKPLACAGHLVADPAGFADLAKVCEDLEKNLVNAAPFDAKRTRPLATEQALYEVEATLKTELWPKRENWKADEAPISALEKLCRTYHTVANKSYASDPVLRGRMLLTIFTFAALLDALVSRWDTTGIVQRHRLPTLPLEVLQRGILVPTATDLAWWNSVHSYLEKRTAEGIDKTIFDPLGLPLAYFDKSPLLSDKLREMLEKQNQAIADKQAEAQRQIKQYQDYQVTLSRQVCCCRTEIYISCNACTTRGNCDRMTIDYYERALPDGECDRRSVIFHMFTPEALRCWRRGLILTWLACQPTLDPQKAGAKHWWPGCTPQIKADCNLGSPTKAFQNTHYQSLKVSSIIGFVDQIIVNQGRKLCLAVGEGIPVGNVTSGLNLEGKYQFHLQDAKYRSLDWVMTPETPYQAVSGNQVIANQDDCHAKLDLNEFVAFGKLRGTGGLQLRHIVQAIISRTSLSFHEPSVVVLLQQALYQPGPFPCQDSEVPPWKQDLVDVPWVKFACAKLLELADSVEKNWERYRTVQCVLLVASYVASVAPDIEARKSAVNVMKRCRNIAEGWIVQTLKAVAIPSNSQQDTHKLYSFLLGVASVVVLSFDTDREDVEGLLLSTTEDALTLLDALVHISDNLGNISLVAQENSLLAATITRTNRIALARAACLHRVIQNTGGEDILTPLLRSRREPGPREEILAWKHFSAPAEQWYFSAYHSEGAPPLIIQLNVITGTLLISGVPVSRLPESISTNDEFKRVFGGHIFAVYRDAQPGTFTSKKDNAGSVFKFQDRRSGDHELATGVLEISPDSTFLHLLPPKILEGTLPDEFISKYSHWLDPSRNRILFRPVRFTADTFVQSATDPAWCFDLTLSGSSFTGVLSSGPATIGPPRRLVSIHSASFQPILAIFGRLEKRGAIHVFVQEAQDPTRPVCQVYLPRLDLTFELSQDGCLEAVNFPGMVVTEDQFLGTLVGFSAYLHLSSKLGSSLARKLVVSALDHFPGQLAYFEYDLNQDLRFLRGATRSANLYLVFLHAATAASLPDPFTGLTGGEMAQHLLNSSWSNAPLDAPSRRILSELLPSVVPRRQRYPEFSWGMLEIPKIPKAFHGQIQLQAHLDVLVLASHLLLEDSQELAALHEIIPEKLTKPLTSRWAYWRWRDYLSPVQRLDSESETRLGLPIPTQSAVKSDPILSNSGQVFRMAQLTRTCMTKIGHIDLGSSVVPSGVSDITAIVNSLSNSLLKSSTLQGISSRAAKVNLTSLRGWLDLSADVCSSPRDYVLTGLARLAMIRPAESTPASDAHTNFQGFSLHLALTAWRFSEGNLSDWKNCEAALLTLGTALAHAPWTEAASLMKKLGEIPRCSPFDNPSQITCDSNTIRTLVTSEREQTPWDKSHLADQSVDGFTKAVLDSPAWADSSRLLPSVTGPEHQFSFRGYFPYLNTSRALSKVQDNYTQVRQALLLTLSLNQIASQLKEVLQAAQWEPRPVIQSQAVGSSPILPQWRPLQKGLERPQANHSKVSALEQDTTRDILQEARAMWKDNISPVIENILLTCLCKDDLAGVKESLPAELPLHFSDVPKDMANTEAYKGLVKDLQISYNAHVDQSQAGDRSVSRLTPTASEILLEVQSLCQERVKRLTELCVDLFAPTDGDQPLQLSGLWSPLQAVTLLPLVADASTPLVARILLAAQMIHRAYLDKIRRSLLLVNRVKKSAREEGNADLETQAVRELQQVRSTHWSPSQHPDWILFEVEQALTIRNIQADVAMMMMTGCEQPQALPGDLDVPSNSYCLQLNMGEGKTSVILPIICASLADANQQVPRVTVLGSLFATNFDLLSRSLSGLLRRRLYVFPCRRDLVNLDDNVFAIVHRQLEECRRGRGCIVTVPEHRLSFRLKLEEFYSKTIQQPSTILAMEKIESWYERHAIDILDESDELLRHKFQLIYPTGSQQAVDGDERRWQVVQGILRVIQERATKLDELLGQSSLLHVPANTPGGWPTQFRRIGRRATTTAPSNFDTFILDALFDGEARELGYLANIQGEARKLLKDFVLRADAPDLDRARFLPQMGHHPHDFFILRALFAHKILDHVLRLRWYVEYGVQPGESPRRLMAVPFRAQGVASDRTEFGHPDVAILATMLSYYYKGLDAEQIRQSFELLMSDNSRDSVYQEWVEAGDIKHLALQTIGGLNLSDPSCVKELVQTFRCNINTINYWLNSVVFPRETKQFSLKLMASAWDLAPRNRFAVRGFSGTNDSRDLLPLGIRQEGLPSVAATNGQVVCNLLRLENNFYHFFEAGVCSGKEILKAMIETKPRGRVLIDTGALMQDLSNERVISEWLELLVADDSAQAGIFFQDNRLLVKTRGGVVTPFDLSPYRNQLERCVVFLDDHHTRGTDLKFPIPSHAYVTLCANMRKDKLVQGCMRMRQLGRGHSVSFWSPHEAHITIVPPSQSSQKISAHEILTWATVNTVRSNIEAMTAWVIQGFCNARKLTAQKFLKEPRGTSDSPPSSTPDPRIYVKMLHFDEVLLVKDLYGKRRETTLLTAHINSKMGAWLRNLEKDTETLDDYDLQAGMLAFFDHQTSRIKERCKKVVQNYRATVQQLDEEQERELEQEQEEEREPERPAKQKPHTPVLPGRLRDGVTSGGNLDIDQVKEFAIPVGQAFDGTSLHPIAKCHATAWDPRLFVTKEFTKAVRFETKFISGDQYQHTPNAVLVLWDEANEAIKLALVLCDFEANALLPLLREACQKSGSNTPVSLHHVIRRNFPNQPESLFSPLSLPSRITNEEWRQREFRPICAQLAVFAASLYHATPERAHVLRFLGLVPPPGRDQDSELDSGQWQLLQAAKLIGSDGFVQRDVSPKSSSQCSERTLQIWQETKETTQFQESCIEFIRGVAGLRNLLGRLAWSQVGSWVNTT